MTRYVLVMTSGLNLLFTIIFMMSVAFLAVYAVLRWRSLKDEEPDPQLGVKALINFFEFILLICALLGFSLIFTALFAKIGKSEGKDLWKVGLGMLWGSGVLFAGFEVFYRMFTNEASFPEVRKSFMGLALVAMGLISIIGFLMFWMGLFDKWKGLAFNFPFGLWLIYLPATAGGLLLYRKMFFPPPAGMPGAYPAGGGYPGGGAGVEQPVVQQPAPEQPMVQAPAEQPYQQPTYQQPGYGQPAQPGYPQPGGYPGGATPAPQSAPAPQQPGYGSPGLPPPGGQYPGSGGYGQ